MFLDHYSDLKVYDQVQENDLFRIRNHCRRFVSHLPYVLPFVRLTTPLDIFVINSMFTFNGRFKFWCYPGGSLLSHPIIWFGIKRCIKSIISMGNLFVISSAVRSTNINVQSVFLRELRNSSTLAFK